MLFKFTIISDEVDNFVRVIEINSDATFFDFHEAILDAANYAKDQVTSFFTCNEDWEKEQEITLMEMDKGTEFDSYVMDRTRLDELMEEEKEKLLYVFDVIYDRALFIELTEIVPDKTSKTPRCIATQGTPPKQLAIEDMITMPGNMNLDEDFYGDESFDMDELDHEGFGGINIGGDNPFGEDF
ncbi:MAG: hypothetical protein LBH80_00730 [Prevotellaceae bacterium]|jgi:hypothetical protein|nr:hypothetical protein [Prevotellaceae bacterium]